MKAFLAVCAVSMSLLACGGLEGEPGPAGPTGPQGPTGKPGENGAPGIGLTKFTTCSGNATLGGTYLSLSTSVYTFADSSVLVACAVWNGKSEFSSVVMYKSGMQGATTGYCSVGSDVDATSGGFWEFTSGASSGTAKYSDTGTANHNTSAALTCTLR